MKRALCFLLFPALIILSGAYALAQETVALRFLCFEDGNECGVYEDLLARFLEENPDIGVVVDVAPVYGMKSILLELKEAGLAPDFARISEVAGLRSHFLDLRPLLGEALTATFREVYFAGLRAEGDDEGLYGFPEALGVVAPFVNVSLFEQAGVAVPGEGASWDEWLTALDAVVVAAYGRAIRGLSVDNKDHRLVGPAMSLGAEYFDEDNRLTLPDAAGLREFLLILHDLMEEGKTPADTLLGTGASQDYFVRGETVMYICGSWKVEEVAAQVGDDFEWAIVPNPSGPAGGTGVVQATMLVAYADTKESEAVAKVFAYLLQPEVSAEFAARTLTIPAREDLAASGIDYQTDDVQLSPLR